MSSQIFERNKWVSKDGVTQIWVNEIIWNLFKMPGTQVPLPPALPGGTNDAATVCRNAILHYGLGGAVPNLYEDKLRKILSSQFYERIEIDRRRTDIFEQELQLLLGPAFNGKVAPVRAAASRRAYQKPGDKTPNPRFIEELVLWVPTLSVRDEVIAVLKDGGYVPNFARDEEAGYAFAKSTMGINHAVLLKGLLWESTKNWSSDVERLIWDRASAAGADAPMKFDMADLFLLACRHYTVDTICGGGAELLDLVTILERAGDSLDWSRIKEVKDQFAKPDWFWAAILGVVFAEQKSGRKVELPDWARSGVKAMNESFWYSFIESRLNWANPDARLVDFPRAYVKLAKGT